MALAALEPHFAGRLLAAVDMAVPASADALSQTMRAPATHEAVAAFVGRHTRQQLDALAHAHDIPLHTMR